MKQYDIRKETVVQRNDRYAAYVFSGLFVLTAISLGIVLLTFAITFAVN